MQALSPRLGLILLALIYTGHATASHNETSERPTIELKKKKTLPAWMKDAIGMIRDDKQHELKKLNLEETQKVELFLYATKHIPNYELLMQNEALLSYSLDKNYLYLKILWFLQESGLEKVPKFFARKLEPVTQTFFYLGRPTVTLLVGLLGDSSQQSLAGNLLRTEYRKYYDAKNVYDRLLTQKDLKPDHFRDAIQLNMRISHVSQAAMVSSVFMKKIFDGEEFLLSPKNQLDALETDIYLQDKVNNKEGAQESTKWVLFNEMHSFSHLNDALYHLNPTEIREILALKKPEFFSIRTKMIDETFWAFLTINFFPEKASYAYRKINKVMKKLGQLKDQRMAQIIRLYAVFIYHKTGNESEATLQYNTFKAWYEDSSRSVRELSVISDSQLGIRSWHIKSYEDLTPYFDEYQEKLRTRPLEYRL
ncbi:MAG: hypothetical protein ACPGXY_05600 [Alphaproteobacteria bacterium]